MAEMVSAAGVETRDRLLPPSNLIFVCRLLLPIVMVAGWQIGVNVRTIDPFFFSSPFAIARQFWEWGQDGALAINLGITLAETLLGYALGVAIGVATGFTLFEHPFIAAVFEPYLAVVNAIPRVILAPLFVLWFGLGMQSKVVLVAIVALLIVFFNTYTGLKEVDKNLIASMRVMGASKRKIRKFVLLPSVVVWIFGSLRATIGLAFAAAIVGEYVGSTHGLGYLIARAQGTFSSAGVFAGLGIVTLVVMIISTGLNALERYMQRWKL